MLFRSIVPAVQTAIVTKSRGMMRMRDPLMSQVRVVEMGGVNNFGEPITAMILVALEASTAEAKDGADWEKRSVKGLRPEWLAIAAQVDLLANGYPAGVPIDELVKAVMTARSLKPSRAETLVHTAVERCVKTGRLAWVDSVKRTLRNGRPGAAIKKF